MKSGDQITKKKIPTKRDFFIAAGVLLIISALFFLISSIGLKFLGVKTKSEDSKVDASYLQLRPSFHPDSVLNLKYQKRNYTREFHRRDRDEAWQPQVYPQRIQEILNLLALIHFEKLPIDTDYDSIFSIQFSNSQLWRAGWKGRSLIWIDGAMKGYGTQLIPSHLLLMQSGTNTFFPREHSWCKSRPSKFEFATESATKQVLINSNGSWELSGRRANSSSSSSSNPGKILTSKIENWLSQFCQFEITRAIDNEYASHFDFLPKLKVIFSEKDSLSIEQSQQNAQLFMFVGNGQDSQLILISTEFSRAFEELMNLVSLN